MSQDEFDVIPFESDEIEEQYHASWNRVLERLQDQSQPKQDQLCTLARLVYERAQDEFFDQYTPEDVVGYLQHLRDQFGAYSQEDGYLLQITNPTVEDEGWYSPYTVLTMVVDDLPFVVDSLDELFRDLDLQVRYALYNPVYLDWNQSGDLVTVEDQEEDARFFVSFHLDEVLPDQQAELRDAIADIMEDLQASVRGFDSMLGEARSTRKMLEQYADHLPTDQEDLLSESQEFLDYLIDGNFVFLGYRSYSLFERDGQTHLQVDQDSGLGVLRDETDSRVYEPTPLDELDETYRERMQPQYLIVVSKSNTQSKIYRRERLDYIGVKRLDDQGNVIGEERFVGLFTNRVLAEPAVDLPILRRKFEQICRREGLEEHSHTYRDFYSTFNGMPKHVLFMSPIDDIISDIRSIIGVHGDAKFKLRARPDLYQHGISIMVLMSKDRFNAEVRRAIQKELQKEFNVDEVDYTLSLGEGDLARLHFHLNTERRSPLNCSFDELEHRLYQISRTWTDRLQELLGQNQDQERAQELLTRYEDALPTEYQALVTPDLALNDLGNFERLRQGAPVPFLDMVQPPNEDYTHLILYHKKQIRLSDVMPVLTNHGLIVLEQSTFRVQPEDVDECYHYHLFRIQDPNGKPINLENRKDIMLQSITGVIRDNFRDDRLNQLVTKQGLSPKTLNLFRLYKNYFHQLQPAIKLETINRTLVQHAGLAEQLYDLFEARFKPDERDLADRDDDEQAIVEKIEEDLKSVPDRTDDQVLRSLMNQIQSTVRTSYYLDQEDRPYFSIKVECQSVDNMPEPRPLYEIFVYSPYMEATHLRGGKVARGGIRWSDRRDDYRTEVLDLMQTQQVKNSLIVPVGSKGGFVLKTEHLSDDKEMAEHAREQYKNFMRGMLDLTDNIVDDTVVHPDNLVCYDGDDPYLVVAADKGTAHLSDTANAISDEFDFWLGDAYASGGSVGYDHKELGITARGAWENVRRHFRELGVDMEEEALTATGIGDMGGDVFGNGMLLSDNLKLQAAFNHRNIFLDPDPDPAESFKERQRLFEQAAGWDEYNEDLISDGGGIFPRSAKTLDLPEACRDLLGLDQDDPSPDEVIRAILKLDVDLLWNGGIGTFIKHDRESHSEVGDPPNDAIRVDAPEVQARVIGEGGNLGITQAGRVQLDQHGVKLNTDALDNSGGVDLSDHEVNLKILFNEAIRTGELQPENREDTLMELTDEVVAKVTRNNSRQSGAVSLERHVLRDELEDFRQLMNDLEDSVDLNREVEGLPDERTLREREQSGEGITRPEMAVLLSYVKMDLYERCRDVEWSDSWVIERFLKRYLPDGIPDRFPEAIDNHPLRREIALTKLVNDIVDYTGVAYFHRLSHELVRPLTQVIRAYLAADHLLDGHRIRSLVADLDQEANANAHYDALDLIRGIMANMVSWIVQTLPTGDSYETFVQRYKPLIDEHRDEILSYLDDSRIQRIEKQVNEWEERGFGDEFTDLFSDYKYALPVMDVLVLHHQTAEPVGKVAECYFDLGSSLHIDWLLYQVFSMELDERWDQLALRTMITEVNELQRTLTKNLLINDRPPQDYLDEHSEIVDRLGEIRQELSREGSTKLSAYHFMIQRIRSLMEAVKRD